MVKEPSPQFELRITQCNASTVSKIHFFHVLSQSELAPRTMRNSPLWMHLYHNSRFSHHPPVQAYNQVRRSSRRSTTAPHSLSPTIALQNPPITFTTSTVMLGPNGIMIPRTTLSIEFGLGRRVFLFTLSPTPVHIAATLKHPLSGVCHTMRKFARNFSVGAGTRRNVFAADLAITGNCPTLPTRVCLKYAAGAEAVAALYRENILYSQDLAELAGVAVPHVYGFFRGGTMASPIACLIMELCMSTEMLKTPDEFWCVWHIRLFALFSSSSDIALSCLTWVAWTAVWRC